jgi:2-methylcitrate dehydratase PrpD
VAITLLKGAPTVAGYSDEAAKHPEVLDLGRRVVVVEDPGMAEGAARVAIDLEGGQCLRAETQHARGSLSQPMTDAELEEKLLRLAEKRISAPHQLVRAIWSLDQLERVDDLITLACPQSG